MNTYGHWVVGLAVAYTALLVMAGRMARRNAQAASGGYFVGGRQFSPLLVAFCITGLFSGSTFIAVLELSYLKGVSAAWYGVAETLQVLLIAVFLVAPFRERSLVTISGKSALRIPRRRSKPFAYRLPQRPCHADYIPNVIAVLEQT